MEKTTNSGNTYDLLTLKSKLEGIEQLLQEQAVANKDVLSIDEAAQYTGLKKSYIYKLSSKRGIPFYKPNHKNIYFKKQELDEWLLRNRHATREEIDQVGENFVVNSKRGTK